MWEKNEIMPSTVREFTTLPFSIFFFFFQKSLVLNKLKFISLVSAELPQGLGGVVTGWDVLSPSAGQSL